MKEVIPVQYENIEIARQEHIAIIKINRPQAMNALSTQTARELLAALE